MLVSFPKKLYTSSLSGSESGACCALVTSEQICLGLTLVAASVKVEGLQLNGWCQERWFGERLFCSP